MTGLGPTPEPSRAATLAVHYETADGSVGERAPDIRAVRFSPRHELKASTALIATRPQVKLGVLDDKMVLIPPLGGSELGTEGYVVKRGDEIVAQGVCTRAPGLRRPTNPTYEPVDIRAHVRALAIGTRFDLVAAAVYGAVTLMVADQSLPVSVVVGLIGLSMLVSQRIGRAFRLPLNIRATLAAHLLFLHQNWVSDRTSWVQALALIARVSPQRILAASQHVNAEPARVIAYRTDHWLGRFTELEMT